MVYYRLTLLADLELLDNSDKKVLTLKAGRTLFTDKYDVGTFYVSLFHMILKESLSFKVKDSECENKTVHIEGYVNNEDKSICY